MIPRLAITGVLALLAAAACGEGSADPTRATDPAGPPQTCPQLAVAIVDDLQGYVDVFAGMTVEDFTRQDPASALLGLLERAEELRALGEQLGCDPEDLERLLAVELDRLRGDGAVADAVAATFRARVVGSPDPADPPAEERRIAPGDSLAVALASVGSGSTLILEPGDHVLLEPLVVLRSVALVGAGAETTRIVSSAGGAVIQYLGEGELRLEALTVEHRGGAPASVLLIHSGSARLDGVAVRGAVRGPEGFGGVGLALASDGQVEVSDSDIFDNELGGIVVSSRQSPTIAASRIRDNGGCGVCFLDASGGTLRASLVTGNDVGVLVEGASQPTVVDNEVWANHDAGLTYREHGGGLAAGNLIAGNGDVGVVVTDGARPDLRRNDISDHARGGIVIAEAAEPTVSANSITGSEVGIDIVGSGGPLVEGNEIHDTSGVAVRLGDRSHAVVRDNRVTGSVEVGILVLEHAVPLVERNTLTHEGVAGIVFLGSSAGRATGNTTSGQDIGIQVSDTASPELVGNSMTRHEQAALVFTGSAWGRADGNVCAEGEFHIVLFDAVYPELGDNDCLLVDQRSY